MNNHTSCERSEDPACVYADDDFALYLGIPNTEQGVTVSPADIFLLGICLSGTCRFRVKDNVYTCKQKDIVILLLGNSAELIEKSDDFDTRFVAITIDFYREHLMAQMTRALAVKSMLGTNTLIRLDDEAFGFLLDYFNLLVTCVTDERHVFRMQVTHQLLSALALWIYGKLPLDFSQDRIVKSHAEQFVETLMLNIIRHFREERQVSFYARLQCVTPKYLSSVCMKTTGRTPSEWINEYVMAEAKMMLKEPMTNVQQVANALHFPDQSTFGKYFKKHAGVTPLAYKMQ